MSAPQSSITICSGVRLDNRYAHTIYFDSASAQREYFAGKAVRYFPAYSHHRKNWELKVEATVSEAQTWNYLIVENPGVKPHYYFINKVEYVSDSTVKLWLELDVIQTHLLYMTRLPCFVERQHTSGDTIGEHTVPEGLELGQYCNYHQYDMESIKDMGIFVLSALDLTKDFESTGETTPAYGSKINGVYSGLGVYAFDGFTYLENKLKKLDELGKADAVVAIWMYPKSLVLVSNLGGILAGGETTWSGFDWSGKKCAYVRRVIEVADGLAPYSNYDEHLFEGYVPRNNKLYTYPYNMLYATNNQGEKAEYRFEWFRPGNYSFWVYGAVSPDAGVRLVPTGYNSVNNASPVYEEGLTLGNYPPCAWDSDAYKVWLAQNYNQLAHSTDQAIITGLSGLGAMAVGAVTGNVTAVGAGALGALGGYSQIQGIMAQKEDAKAQPPQAKGTFSSTVNVASGKQTFTFYYKSIRREFARQIDDYFTMFGYRVNRVTTPNICARRAYTFVKTVGCKVSGPANNDDIVAIEAIFDNGITFWRDGDRVGDYSQDNTAYLG